MKQTIKKVIAFGLTVTMMVGMSTIVFASNPQSIQIDDQLITFSNVTQVENKEIDYREYNEMGESGPIIVQATILYLAQDCTLDGTISGISVEKELWGTTEVYTHDLNLPEVHIVSPVTGISNTEAWLNGTMYVLIGQNYDEYGNINKMLLVGLDADTTPTTPEPAPANAIPTASTVLVNGTNTAFDAYTIDGTNYFKLRDIAYAINGSDKQFNVSWDGEKNAINLVPNTAYAADGTEMAIGDGVAKNAVLSTSSILKDGVSIELVAYTINGNNYFKLRDLCSTFDIGVTWDNSTNTIGIDTSIGYTE